MIEYMGETSDVRPFIAKSLLYSVAILSGGGSRSLLEGAAMARPLIATDVPGCRDVVVHGKNGYLCKVMDAESLASRIA